MRLFVSSNINITTEGKCHLEAALGNSSFCDEYIQLKVEDWCREMEKLYVILLKLSHKQPSLHIYMDSSISSHISCAHCPIQKHLKPLDDIINEKLIPTLFGSSASPAERDLFSLPIRLGGMGMSKPEERAQSENDTSKAMTVPLVAIPIMQGSDLPDNECGKTRSEIKAVKKS